MVSAAQRRRQRRLRSWWRHEQQSIAAALATSQHHSALRGQKKARAEEGGFRVELCGEDPFHPPPQAAGTVYYPMDEDDVLAARGSRPDRLSAVSGLQERVPRHIVEQIVDIVPVVQLLHVLVPHQVDSVVEVLKILDKSLPNVEQVIEVPKILQHTVLQHSSLQEPQLAEQLVEVPTPSPALAPVPQTEHQLVEVPPIVPQLVGFFAGDDGYVWRQLSGPTGACWWRWAPLTSSGPPHRGTPPGQGGIEILAAATLADVVVVDVPVHMQHMFQQSLVLHSVHQQSGGSSSCYTKTGMHSVVVQKTVEIPQLQFLDLVVVPVSCNDKFWYRQCRKLLWCCGRHCDHTARSSSPVVRSSRDSVQQSAGHSSYAHSAVLEQGC